MKRLMFASGLVLSLTGMAAALEPPKDPLFTAKGDIGQGLDDMWGFHAVGLTVGPDSAWRLLPATLPPVTVAVIDSGLDWDHLDIAWDNIWQNPSPGGAGARYAGDKIGWDFMGHNNKPWDHDGHGTFVSGIIAGTWNNNAGIAGINPTAKIMVLKALNDFGNTRASYLAEAIVYAADHGAKIINMSVGGKGTTKMEAAAVRYAVSKGCLIILAAGNDGVELKDYALTGQDGVITVGASDHTGQRAVFSNWGAAVDIVAPGIDILSLRARYTDTLRDIPGATYKAGGAYVGADKRYYVAGGTSFAAPIVTGIASLLLANDPTLTGSQIRRMLLNSARDVGEPGLDQFTGYGMVDARAALRADRNFFIDSRITGVGVVTGAGGTLVQVKGTADGDNFGEAHLEIGSGEKPASFKAVGSPLATSVKGGVLGEIAADNFRGANVWIVRLVVTHKNGRKQEARFRLQLG